MSSHPESDSPTMEERVTRLERHVLGLAETAAALADDNLRLVAILTEFERAGVLPPLPWRLATFHVELRHVKEAEARGDTPADGVPLSERVAALWGHLEALRGRFDASLPPGLPYSAAALERTSDEPPPP